MINTNEYTMYTLYNRTFFFMKTSSPIFNVIDYVLREKK